LSELISWDLRQLRRRHALGLAVSGEWNALLFPTNFVEDQIRRTLSSELAAFQRLSNIQGCAWGFQRKRHKLKKRLVRCLPLVAPSPIAVSISWREARR
jgi:hypothetical protein